MAKTVGELYLSLGLNLDQLQIDFAAADKSVNAYMKQMQGQITQNRIRLDIIDNNVALTDAQKAEEKLKVLNDTLTMQQSKLNTAKAAWQNYCQSNAAALETQSKTAVSAARQMETAMLREEAALRRTEAAIKALQTPKQATGMSGLFDQLANISPQLSSTISAIQVSVNSMKAMAEKAKNMRSAVSAIGKGNGLPKLATDAAVADGAAGKLLNTIKAIPAPLAAAGVAMGAVAAAVAFDKTAAAAIKAKNEVNFLAAKMHSTAKEAGALSKALKLSGTGLDADALVTSVLRLDKAVQTGSKSTVQMLDTFGVKLKNADGTLKSHAAQIEELAAGYQRAARAGLEEEYALQLLGTKGKDLIPVFQNFAELKERAANTPSISLVSTDEAAKAIGLVQEFEFMMGQLGGIVKQALVPIAEATLPAVNLLFKDLIKLVNECEPEIRLIGYAAGIVFDAFILAVDGAVIILRELLKAVHDFVDYLAGAEDKTGGIFGAMREAGEGLLAMFGKAGKSGQSFAVDQGAHMKALAAITETSVNSQKDALDDLGDSLKTLEADSKRVFEEYAKNIADSLKRAGEINAEMQRSIYERTHSAFELQLYDIDRWREAQLSRSATAEETAAIIASAAEKEAVAYEAAAKRIQGINDSVIDKIYKMSHTAKENALYDLNKELNKLAADGADINLLKQYEQMARADIAGKYKDDKKRPGVSMAGRSTKYDEAMAKLSADESRYARTGSSVNYAPTVNVNVTGNVVTGEFADQVADDVAGRVLSALPGGSGDNSYR